MLKYFLLFLISFSLPCCKKCIKPKQKVYSIPPPYENCGETCINPKYYNFFKKIEPTIKLSNVSNPCYIKKFKKYIRTDREAIVFVDIYGK